MSPVALITGLPIMDIASVFEWFAQESMNAAEQANEPRQRETFLKLALLWTAAAQQCRCEAPAMQSTSASS
jgi:hypothetical protein